VLSILFVDESTCLAICYYNGICIYCFSKNRFLCLIGRYGVISQKMIIIIVTAVETSNLTWCNLFIFIGWKFSITPVLVLLTLQCRPLCTVQFHSLSHVARLCALYQPVQWFIQTTLPPRVSYISQSCYFMLKDKTLRFQLIYNYTLASNF
jgi:hypothetical protein